MSDGAGSKTRTPHTGLRCPRCKQAAAIIENQLPTMLVFLCTACGHRWSATERGAPKQ